METNNLQLIFDVISSYLPKKWKKVALYFAISGNLIDPKFYVDLGQGYIDCFQLGYEDNILMDIFFSLEKILTAERNALAAKNKWSVFTMFVTSTGKVEANYEYNDIRDTYIDYQQNWERKYIKSI